MKMEVLVRERNLDGFGVSSSIAPEMLTSDQDKWTNAIHIWALGVIALDLFIGSDITNFEY
jgi:hypothetical protein